MKREKKEGNRESGEGYDVLPEERKEMLDVCKKRSIGSIT